MEKESDLKYCESDYRSYHNWERVGVYRYERVTQMRILYQCNQCGKCKSVIVKWVKGGIISK